MSKNSRFKHIIGLISKALNLRYSIDDIDTDPDLKSIMHLLALAKIGYVLVPWPKSQEYMEQAWFEEEAILALESASYFIPIKRLL